MTKPAAVWTKRLSRSKLADATFERYQNLFKEQAVSRQEFDVRQTEKDMASQGVARAEARLKQAQEGSKASATMSDYTQHHRPDIRDYRQQTGRPGRNGFPRPAADDHEDEGSYQLELALPESLAAKSSRVRRCR